MLRDVLELAREPMLRASDATDAAVAALATPPAPPASACSSRFLATRSSRVNSWERTTGRAVRATDYRVSRLFF